MLHLLFRGSQRGWISQRINQRHLILDINEFFKFLISIMHIKLLDYILILMGYALIHFTGLRRFGYSSLHKSQVVPSHPLAEQY